MYYVVEMKQDRVARLLVERPVPVLEDKELDTCRFLARSSALL